jgi:DNA-binding transcriptional LysR family regulator
VNLLEAMRIYVRVVERGSISGAARDLNIGQPAASERIERLEKYLGCRLLLRNARAFKCTPEGEIFYERSKRILSAAEQAVAEVSNDEQVLNGLIRIGAPHCFGEVVVPELLKLVRFNHPHLNIDLTLNDKIVDLVTEGVDISFRLGHLGEGAFIACPLGQVGYMLVASSDYQAQHGPICEPSELAKHPFIRLKGAFGTEQLPLRHGAGVVESVPISSAITTNHWSPMYELITESVGIGVMEDFACADALASGSLVRILPQYEVPSLDLHVLIQAQRPVPIRVRLIVNFLKEAIPELLGTVRNALV